MNSAHNPKPRPPSADTDPVLVRREQVARWSNLGQRVGGACLAVAVMSFIVALVADFPSWSVTLTAVALIVGSIILLPAMVLSLAARAAEREELTGSDGH